MGVSGGGALAIDFTLEHPEMVDALIPVAAGVSGYHPSEEEKKKYPDAVRMYMSLNEAFEQHDMARAVEISLELWTDGPGRLPHQADPHVREQIREMTTRNWQRPDGEVQAENPPIPLEPPAIGRLSEISVPTLVILGALDGPNPLEQLPAEIPGAKKIVMAETAHHPFMEKPAEFQSDRAGFSGIIRSLESYMRVVYVFELFSAIMYSHLQICLLVISIILPAEVCGVSLEGCLPL